MKQILFLFLIVSSFTMFGQSLILNVGGEHRNIKQAFNVVDPLTNNFVIFLEDGDQLQGIMYDRDYNELGRASTPKLPSKYEFFVGSIFKENKVSFLMNTSSGKNYAAITFDFSKGNAFVQELDFKIKGERFIQAISAGENVYLITVPKKSSQFNVYKFTANLQHTLHEVVLEEGAIVDRKERPIKLTSALKPSGASKIDLNAPHPLETTANKFKLYYKNKNVFITLDYYSEFTQLLKIDLSTFIASSNRIYKPKINGLKSGIRTNSFINDDKIFQITANSDEFKFQVYDLKSDKGIKEYALTDNDKISFKNTPIIQKGGDLNSYRELEKTTKFLRKISQGHLGVSVYKQNGISEITFGSTKEKTNNSMILAGALLGGMAGVIIMASIDNLTSSYGLYKNTASVRIIGLFDEAYNHVEGEIAGNPFDRIKEASMEQKGIKAEMVFRLNETYLWGFFNKKTKEYQLFKFE